MSISNWITFDYFYVNQTDVEFLSGRSQGLDFLQQLYSSSVHKV